MCDAGAIIEFLIYAALAGGLCYAIYRILERILDLESKFRILNRNLVETREELTKLSIEKDTREGGLNERPR